MCLLGRSHQVHEPIIAMLRSSSTTARANAARLAPQRHLYLRRVAKAAGILRGLSLRTLRFKILFATPNRNTWNRREPPQIPLKTRETRRYRALAPPAPL